MKTRFVQLAAAGAVTLLCGCGLDSTVSTGSGYPCRDQVRPSSGSLFVRYSNPSDFDTVIVSLDPRSSGYAPYTWSPSKGTRSDVVKGLGFVKYWVMARYIRGGDTVDVFDSETIEDGESTNSAGCVTYDPRSSVDLEIVTWPK